MSSGATNNNSGFSAAVIRRCISSLLSLTSSWVIVKYSLNFH